MPDKKQRSTRRRLSPVSSVPISLRQQIRMVTTAETRQGTEVEENPIDSKLSRFGETALHKAAIKNNIEECYMLIALGADLNSVDNYGWTPLHEACNHGHYNIAELLIRQGADINRKSKSGTTPLIDAVINDHTDVIQLLLENGADVNVKDRHGQSALTHPYVREFLRREASNQIDKVDVVAEEESLIVPPPSPQAPVETSSWQVEVAAAAAAATVVENESSSFVEEEIDVRASSSASAAAAEVCTPEEEPSQSDHLHKTSIEVSVKAEIISSASAVNEKRSTLQSTNMSEEENEDRPLSPGGIRNMIASTSSDEVAAAVRTMMMQKWRHRISNPINRNLPPLPGLADFKNLSAQYDWDCYKDSFSYDKRPTPDELPHCSKLLFELHERKRANLSCKFHIERAQMRRSFERQAAKIYNRLNGSLHDMTIQRFMREVSMPDPSPMEEDPPFKRFLLDAHNNSGLNPFSFVDLVQLMHLRKADLIQSQKAAAVQLSRLQRREWREHYRCCVHAAEDGKGIDESAKTYVYTIEVNDDFEVLPSSFVENAESYERQIAAMNINF
ncbi:hypothetical protein M514_08203 [Trichuris suis]|uniref:Uncharacterized protein n=1 Tax=Trichuris suis TaxID=68888 RepID=A0A085N7A2_9BILA|nr:hypothetical protein M514_08203 [Trichuris suis]